MNPPEDNQVHVLKGKIIHNVSVVHSIAFKTLLQKSWSS